MKLTAEDIKAFCAKLDTWISWRMSKHPNALDGYVFRGAVTVCHKGQANGQPFFKIAGPYGVIAGQPDEMRKAGVRPRIVAFEFLMNNDFPPAVVLDELAHRLDHADRKVGDQILCEALEALVKKDEQMEVLKAMEKEAQQEKKMYEAQRLGLTTRMQEAQQELDVIEQHLKTMREENERIADGGTIAVVLLVLVNLMLIWR